MCKINNLLVMPYKNGKRVMFCVIDPERIKSDGSPGLTLKSGFCDIDESAEWIKKNSEVNNTAVGTSSCPLVEAMKQGGKFHAA